MSKHILVIESYQGSVERHYFQALQLLKDFNFKVIKTKDTFTSSITSSFWGSIEQRRTLQQEKASQFLATTANMIKSMFQIIRSLRIMDERLEYYKQAKSGKDRKSAEIALKGIWIDLVEGGAKNPASVYGLAMQVGFSTLPDLFFDITPKNEADLKKKLKELEESGLNRKIIEVLRRKLTQYMHWRDKTEIELKTSRKFHLAYLRQHFNTIRLYLNWVKPYLKNVKRLGQKGSRQEDLLEMADTAIADIELFAYPSDFKKYKKFMPTINVTFEFRTVPQLVFQQEYQRGPIHIGKTTIIFEGRVMLIDEIREKFRQEMLEDIKILKDLNASMSALGDDLIKYLEEAQEADPSGKLGKKIEKRKVKPPKPILKMLGPFQEIGKGFKQIFGSFKPKPAKIAQEEPLIYELPPDIEKMWKIRKQTATRGKKKVQFKTREEFNSDKAYKQYLEQVRRKNTQEEENEFKAAKKLVDKKGDRVWKIYDTFKKESGFVRW